MNDIRDENLVEYSDLYTEELNEKYSEPIKLKQKHEGTLQLEKSKIALILGVVVLVIGFGIMNAFDSSNQQDQENLSVSSSIGSSADALNAMPASYSDLPKVKPPKKEVVSKKENNDYAKLLEYLLEKKRREEEQLLKVRSSSMEFSVSGGGNPLEQAASQFGVGGLPFGAGGLPPGLPGGFAGMTPDQIAALSAAGGGGVSPVGLGAGLPGISGGGGGERDNANRQDDKERFLEEAGDSSVFLNEKLFEEPLTKYDVQAGSIIPGLLLTGINSDLPGMITGQVSQNVYDSPTGNYLLIPQGTKVVGSYDSRITFGQSRVLIRWDRLIFPNGASISIKGMPGTDLSGYSGINDEVHNHYGKIVFATLIGSVMGAGAQIAEGTTNTQQPTFSQLAAAGAAQELNSVGQRIVDRMLDIQPTLVVNPGFRFNIFVHKDISLKPYEA